MDSELDVVSRPQVPIHLQRHAGSSLFPQTNPQGPHLCSEGKQGDRWTFAGHPRCAQMGVPGETPREGPLEGCALREAGLDVGDGACLELGKAVCCVW